MKQPIPFTKRLLIEWGEVKTKKKYFFFSFSFTYSTYLVNSHQEHFPFGILKAEKKEKRS